MIINYYYFLWKKSTFDGFGIIVNDFDFVAGFVTGFDFSQRS